MKSYGQQCYQRFKDDVVQSGELIVKHREDYLSITQEEWAQKNNIMRKDKAEAIQEIEAVKNDLPEVD